MTNFCASCNVKLENEDIEDGKRMGMCPYCGDKPFKYI